MYSALSRSLKSQPRRCFSTCFSGVQPSGTIHIGNYLGAIENWVRLQSGPYDNIMYGVMDLHAITTSALSPQELRNSIHMTTAVLLASGIDPKKSMIIQQSQVPQHTELNWMLTCVTPLGQLSRMTQYKQKCASGVGSETLGLLSYPVLMAADVLLYNDGSDPVSRTTVVPVGHDQLQHLELASDIARMFNKRVKKEYFKAPKPLLQPNAARIMNLRDASAKMSKSDPVDATRINLTDTAEQIRAKFAKAKTDCHSAIYYNPDERPEVSNLLDIFSSISGKPIDDIVNDRSITGKGSAHFKAQLADAVIARMQPISSETNRLLKDPEYITSVLREGSQRASVIAEETMKQVKHLLGFSMSLLAKNEIKSIAEEWLKQSRESNPSRAHEKDDDAAEEAIRAPRLGLGASYLAHSATVQTDAAMASLKRSIKRKPRETEEDEEAAAAEAKRKVESESDEEDSRVKSVKAKTKPATKVVATAAVVPGKKKAKNSVSEAKPVEQKQKATEQKPKVAAEPKKQPKPEEKKKEEKSTPATTDKVIGTKSKAERPAITEQAAKKPKITIVDTASEPTTAASSVSAAETAAAEKKRSKRGKRSRMKNIKKDTRTETERPHYLDDYIASIKKGEKAKMPKVPKKKATEKEKQAIEGIIESD